MIPVDWDPASEKGKGLQGLSSGYSPVMRNSEGLDYLKKINWFNCLSGKRDEIESKRKKEEEWGIIITDRDVRILWVNEIFTKITGYEFMEVAGKNPSILKSGQHDKKFYENMWRSLALTGRWKGEIWDLRKDATLYPESLCITAVKDDRGEVILYVGVFRELAEPLKCMDHRKTIPSFQKEECIAII